MRDGVPTGEGPRKIEFDPPAIRRMFRLRLDGETDAAIARRFGTSPRKIALLIGKSVRLHE